MGKEILAKRLLMASHPSDLGHQGDSTGAAEGPINSMRAKDGSRNLPNTLQHIQDGAPQL